MIPEFYKDRDIFVTGGTGVVGKALIEKLLRSCNVRKIFLLVRPKKGATIEARLDVLYQDAIFRRLRTEKANEFHAKVKPIPGDVQLPMLGITSTHAKLMGNVSIVFHGAATIRFNEPLKTAIKLNVGGTLETMRVAETLKHLEVFMHVSTFFSNPYLEYVEEKWYESPMDWRFCLDLSSRNDVSDEMLEALTKKLITGFPNTYTFTKNIAEALVNDYRNKLPVIIYRPSIVVCATEEPEPGFPTGIATPMGLLDLAGAGIVKTLYYGKNVITDIAFQDIVVKCMIYYAMKSAKRYAEGRPAAIPVLHTSSCTHSQWSLAQILDHYESHGNWKEAALKNSLLLPGVKCTDSRLLYMSLVMLQQILPALLVDQMLILWGRKPVFMATQRKIFSLTSLVTPFYFNNYGSSGISYYEQMLNELKGSDFDVGVVKDMNSVYFYYRTTHENSYRVREICFKEDPSTLPHARRLMKVKIILYRAVKIFLTYKLYNVIMPMIFNWEQSVDNSSINTHHANTMEDMIYNRTTMFC